jgi:hypothetical protein
MWRSGESVIIVECARSAIMRGSWDLADDSTGFRQFATMMWMSMITVVSLVKVFQETLLPPLPY